MKDVRLREIVFRVRENELAGRDPFYLIDAEEKLAFFQDLEKKVEKENKKLSHLHQWLHSNIENLDYGAAKKDGQSFLQKPAESPINENLAISSSESDLNRRFCDAGPKDSKIVVEGSDGSVKPETDPEVKSIMKDIGKDLDRRITEKEIREAADLMTKLPERNKKFNKLKREMELFGPQAVVSKYQEYAEEKEEDYLWWLDLPHVLSEEQRIGFYALEMAADLELEPKPHHVIAFEDTGDCKKICYIIQAHMDMIGNGRAFVVPQPPKDAFREAKANGFGVTVIRKE
ncbi:hypothetical protein CRYUN_Cryun23aG0127000 [Craigia yunnanensis]